MLKSDFFQLSDYLNITEKNISNNIQFNSINIIKYFSVFDYHKEIINDYLDISIDEIKLYMPSKVDIKRKEESSLRLENIKNNTNIYFNKNITSKHLKKEEKRKLKIEKKEFQYIQLSNKDNNNNSKENDLLDNFHDDELNDTIKDDTKEKKNIYLNLNIFNNINFTIDNNINYKSNNIKFDVKKEYLNKKRKNNFECNNNNHYIPDYDLKKIRSMILDCLIEYINNKIKQFKKNKISVGICKLQFLPINKEKLYHSKIEIDKQFLNKQIKELLSWDISKKYTNYLRDQNSQLVQTLISSENGEYFRDLFELTFLDCLKYINGTKNSTLLDGFPEIEEIVVSKGIKDKQDIERYTNYIKNYEIGLSSKISRYSKKAIKS